MRRAALAAIATFCLAQAQAQDGVSTEWAQPVISSDLSALPEPVRAIRLSLMAAARSGNIENLRPIFETQAELPVVSFGMPRDPVTYLKQVSEDADGAQILSVLLNLLDAPYAWFPGTEGEKVHYVWPYLATLSNFSDLPPNQKVDAYRILTTKEVTELKQMDAWYFWRVVISETGDVTAFVAGD